MIYTLGSSRQSPSHSLGPPLQLTILRAAAADASSSAQTILLLLSRLQNLFFACPISGCTDEQARKRSMGLINYSE